MLVSIITLFPEVFKPFLESSILAKAQKRGKLRVNLSNLRDFGIGPHFRARARKEGSRFQRLPKRGSYKQVDDRPYGGGVGMILKVDVIAKALEKVKNKKRKTKTVLLTPQGKTFNQKIARKLAREKHLILICGHYEGVDERVHQLVDEEISVGDYILTGGEIAAMVILDAVARLIPGVLEKEATQKESFSTYTLNAKPYTLLEPPQYTRPEEFARMRVPKVLLSGNHQKIKEWRLKEALKKTKRRRPDLLMTNV
ncbi:tRNA (guanosine(37)-N1)-methyltransferase TrmD [candidate division WWE3 bacterium CG09_land_8_20_14_0_10_47_33]|nr:MAG: tRNA (guanosine(37)-N1)-methyltransferase TrmD [candidate division WWE3 bacterium CG09_land_8_20_14_0_10_47_33]PIZ41246.1 MAG: tRNA (guanosine(37)-N1)-methyltransferase TrmD [candidate division WWE3 bacterium CG_4_10_14_0_2_um_filter_47_8]PJE52327.1 MAG: tRNA (guanosine(37)-N1)-methyltransferase TrmD [candidate division WWE3 bacterium CG10_big_fil_rev_8_21_14_0_10_48_23]